MNQPEMEKLLNAAKKEWAKNSGWNTSRGLLFRATDFLFFAVAVSGYSKSSSLNYFAFCKPLPFDDLFWKIVGLEDNAKCPLSFRATGAWTAPMMTLASGSVPISAHTVEELKLALVEIFTRIEPAIEKARNRAPNVLAYLQLVEEAHSSLAEKHPDAARNIWIDRLLTAVLNNDYSLAREIITQRKQARDEGGFVSGPGWKTFYDMAEDYLNHTG